VFPTEVAAVILTDVLSGQTPRRLRDPTPTRACMRLRLLITVDFSQQKPRVRRIGLHKLIYINKPRDIKTIYRPQI
jgi:hypothetical protein